MGKKQDPWIDNCVYVPTHEHQRVPNIYICRYARYINCIYLCANTHIHNYVQIT